ncbi:unnamed protein product [Polarella glacialis]|uniref:Uncharacterized protein n=1 Tax=Polarella glacialis TaxID=89957 RepID=A0A813H2F8_POLGL|nr:unnamed protein product [Polarella glacialis]
MDECEDLVEQLEISIQAPSSTASEILSLVAAMPSASEPANRTLSPEFRHLLDDVAEHHSGQVPLHGRLLAQWMHHAYPRECPYPHVSGTKKPPSLTEYQESEIFDEAELLYYFEKTANASVDNGLCSSMWTLEEELVDPQGHEALSGAREGSLLYL